MFCSKILQYVVGYFIYFFTCAPLLSVVNTNHIITTNNNNNIANTKQWLQQTETTHHLSPKINSTASLKQHVY